MGAPSPELGYIGLKAHMESTAESLGRRLAVVTYQLMSGEAGSTEAIADTLLMTATRAALGAGAGARSAKEASHA